VAELQPEQAHPLLRQALAQLLARKPSFCAGLRTQQLELALSVRPEVALLAICHVLRVDVSSVRRSAGFFTTLSRTLGEGFVVHERRTLARQPALWEALVSGGSASQVPAFVDVWWTEQRGVKAYIEVGPLLRSHLAAALACAGSWACHAQL
jgi:hypothetical protein